MREHQQERANSTANELTQMEAVAIGRAGAQAVDPGNQTPLEARVAALEAMQEEAVKQGKNISKEEMEQLSEVFISALESRGAFQAPESTSVERPPSTPLEPAAIEAVTPPQRKTFAQRILG